MGALEALAGELAARNASDAQIERMRVLQSRMVAMYDKGDRRGYFRVNEEIHQLILAAANNAFLARLVRTVSVQVRRARYQANLSPERWAAAVAEHEEILDAFANRSAARLSRLLKRHLANKLAALIIAMDKER
jgi:DNA-binding GntR family transcriptional regulator